MNKIVLDFRGSRYLGEVYKVIKEGMGFPDNCGENLDALWDFFWGYSLLPLTIEIKNMSDFTRRSDSNKDYIKDMYKVFDRIHNEFQNIVFVFTED